MSRTHPASLASRCTVAKSNPQGGAFARIIARAACNALNAHKANMQMLVC